MLHRLVNIEYEDINSLILVMMYSKNFTNLEYICYLVFLLPDEKLIDSIIPTVPDFFFQVLNTEKYHNFPSYFPYLSFFSYLTLAFLILTFH